MGYSEAISRGAKSRVEDHFPLGHIFEPTKSSISRNSTREFIAEFAEIIPSFGSLEYFPLDSSDLIVLHLHRDIRSPQGNLLDV